MTETFGILFSYCLWNPHRAQLILAAFCVQQPHVFSGHHTVQPGLYTPDLIPLLLFSLEPTRVRVLPPPCTQFVLAKIIMAFMIILCSVLNWWPISGIWYSPSLSSWTAFWNFSLAVFLLFPSQSPWLLIFPPTFKYGVPWGSPCSSAILFFFLGDLTHSSDFIFFFTLHHTAYEVLVPQLGIDPGAPAVKALSPNHWTYRELSFLKKKLFLFF